MCFIFHKWSKWERYNHEYYIIPGFGMPKEMQGKRFNAVDLRQKRECTHCGTTQDKLVVENVSYT